MKHLEGVMSGKIKFRVAVNEREGSGNRDGTVIRGDEMTLSCDETVSYRASSDEEFTKLIQCCAI